MAIDRRKSAAKRFEDDRKKKSAAAAKKAEQEKKAAAKKSQKQNKPVRSPGKDITTSVRDTFRQQAAKPQFGAKQTAAQRMQGRSENWARLEAQKAGADKSTRKKIEAAQDRLHKANRKDAKGMTFDSATGQWKKGGKPAYTPNVLPGMSRDAQRAGMERSLRNGIVAPDMQKAAKKHQDAVWDRVHGPETGERFGLGLESVGKSVKGFLPALGETLAQDARNARTDWNNPKLKVLVREASRLQRELNIRGLPTGGETRKEKAQRLQDLLRQIDELRDKTAVDQNQYGQRMMRESAEAAQEATRGLSGATKFAADTALGIAGNAPALALSAVPVVGQGLSLGMMGGQAAAQKTAQLNARGIAPGEALARGVAAGGIEALTEKLPLDELVKVAKTGGRGAVKNVLKQMGMEATEESVSYALNYAADKIAGDPEAQFTLRELAGNALGGAVSGGILSGGATAVNRARNLPKTPQALPIKTQETANTLPQDIQNEIDNPESAVADVKMQEQEVQTPTQAEKPGLTIAYGKPQAGTYDSFLQPMVQLKNKLESDLKNARSMLPSEMSEKRIRELESHLDEVRTEVRQMETNRAQFTAAQETAAALGAKFEIANLGAAAGKYENGTITINPYTGNPVRQVFVHEMTHYIESSGQYDALRGHVLQYIAQDMHTDVKAMQDEIIRDYAQYGVKLDETGAQRELVAKFCEEKLFTDEKSIQRLAQTDAGLFGRIRQWISDTIRKLRGTKQENALREMERLYEKAARTVGQVQTDGGAEYLFSRERDEIARMRAAQMERSGVSREEIWRNLGLIRDTKGNWVREIDDSGMQFDADGFQALRENPRFRRLEELTDKSVSGQNLTAEEDAEMEALANEFEEAVWSDHYLLREYIKHDELFRRYPSLKNTSLVFEDMKPGEKGFFDTRDNSIHISNELKSGPQSTLIHEIQHVIQKRDGRPSGASPEYWKMMTESDEARTPMELYKNTAGEIEAREAANRRTMTADERRKAVPDLGWDRAVFAEDAGETAYSIQTDANGDTFVDVTEDILDGKTEKDHARILSDIIQNKFGNIIQANGQTFGINSKTNSEWRRSKSASSLYKKDRSAYLDKIRAFDNADELMTASHDYVGEGLKHPRKDRFVEFARGKVSYRVGENRYTADVIVGIGADGRADLYDIVNIQRKKIAEARILPVNGKENSAPIGDASAIDSIPRTGQDGNTQNSLGLSFGQLRDNVNGARQTEAPSAGTAGLTVSGVPLPNPVQNAPGLALPGMQPQDVGQVAADATTGAAPSGFDPYTHAANEYGTIQPGENPARMVDVPKSMDGEDRVRRFARTTMEAQATPDEMIPLFEEGVTEGLFSYHPRKNADDLANALGFIERNGAELSLKAWDEKMKGGTVNTDDLIRAQILYKLAAKAGDTQTAMRLAGQIAAEYTKAGQMVQSARLLKKATPEGKYAFIQRSVQNLQEQLNKKRGKDAPQITINEQLAQNVLDAKDTAALDTASEALYRDIAKQIPGTWVDKANAWRYLAMLGNPRTHIRNLVGNVMFSVPVGVKNKVGAALERVFVPEGQRTKSLAPADKAAREFAKADAQEMMDVLKDGGKYNPTDIIRQYQDPFSPKNLLGRTLNKASNWNSNALDAEDGIFLGYHYRNALAGYMKANGFTPEQMRNELGEATPELERARTYAIREAQKATFRDASRIADMLSKAEQTNAASRLALGGFIPFKKTPVNILKRGVEYSPAGIIKGIKEAAVDLRQGTKTPAEVIDSFASGITGTALMALGAFLAKEGWLTGADAEERKEQYLDDAEGLQSYALNLGDYTYTVDWSAPASLPLFMGVELWNALDNGVDGDSDGKLDAFVTALQNITEPIFNLTMMDGVQGAIQSATYSEGNKVTAMAGNTISDYFGQFMPTLLGQVARTVDDTRRTTYKGNKITGLSSLDQWIQRQQNKIPGVSKKNAPYMDVFGQTDTEPNTALRAFENFLSPGYISRKKENGAIDGLRALYETTGESSALPSRADTSFRVDGEEVKLSQDEYVKFVQKRGKTMQDSLDVLFGSKSYQDMSDADRLAAVQKVFQYATAEAKTGVSAYKMDSDQERARDSGVSPGLWYGYQQQMSAREAAEQEKYTYMPEIIDKIMNEETLDDGKRQKFVQSLVIDGISDKQKDLYAAAKNDVPADVWAKTYYKFREIEETLDGTGSEKNEAKRAYLFADQGLSGKQKSILDEAMIQDALYIPKDVVVDYSSPESFVLTQMSNAAQEKFSRFGMPVQDYAKYYPIASQGGKKKAEVLEELRAAGMSAGEAESFYKTLKSKNGSSSGKSSKGKSSGGGSSGKGKTGPKLPSKPSAPKLRLP